MKDTNQRKAPLKTDVDMKTSIEVMHNGFQNNTTLKNGVNWLDDLKGYNPNPIPIHNNTEQIVWEELHPFPKNIKIDPTTIF